MLFRESFSMALTSLYANKMRSLLTMLGIIIGVGAVIALVSVGMGVKSNVTNSIAGRDLNEVCRIAADAVKEAHISGGVPNIVIEAGARDEEGFAALVCFFEFACAISGYMSGVNPFNQPGVEAYKKNMFRMLGKPGAV